MPSSASRADRPSALAGTLALVVGLSVGCASALREPPPMEALGGPGGTAGRAEQPIGTPDELIIRAEKSFARRPDGQSVAQARMLYLAAARADESRVDALLGAGRVIAWLVEHERDPKVREALATEGVQVGQWCLRRASENVECAYRLALALGQQARERPTTANDALPRIVALLEQVIAAEPHLDNAGGDRVLALVLLRAPGWPAGPGDPEAGLEHARQAAARVPDHPANWLVLGEALAVLGDTLGARDAYRQAEELAQGSAHAGDPDASEWLDAAVRARGELR